MGLLQATSCMIKVSTAQIVFEGSKVFPELFALLYKSIQLYDILLIVQLKSNVGQEVILSFRLLKRLISFGKKNSNFQAVIMLLTIAVQSNIKFQYLL